MSAGVLLAGPIEPIELTPGQQAILIAVLAMIALAFVGIVLLVIAGGLFFIHRGRTDPEGLAKLRRARFLAAFGGFSCLPLAIAWAFLMIF